MYFRELKTPSDERAELAEHDRNREIGAEKLERGERFRVNAEQHPNKPEKQCPAREHEMWHAFGPPFRVGDEWHATWTHGETYLLTDDELVELRLRHSGAGGKT